MNTLTEFLAIIHFLGDSMTEEQASRLMDEAKENLSIADITRLYYKLEGGPMYTMVSQYNAEMGGLSFY
jgi:hypothetical protein